MKEFLLVSLFLNVILFIWMCFEFQRGVSAERKRSARMIRLARLEGEAHAKKDQAGRARRLIHESGDLMNTMGIKDEAMEDALLLMDAAQKGIEDQMLNATRRKGEPIDAPRRTHYAGKPIKH